MNNTRAIEKLASTELRLGIAGDIHSSWHAKYAHSPYIFVGNLHFGLTEGDALSIFEQYGRVVEINLVRDKASGKSKGFAFLKYEDPKSAILAVDNFNGINVLDRTLRVDHVETYKKKKRDDTDQVKTDNETQQVDESVPPTEKELQELEELQMFQKIQQNKSQQQLLGQDPAHVDTLEPVQLEDPEAQRQARILARLQERKRRKIAESDEIKKEKKKTR